MGKEKHDTDEWMEGTSAALREAGFKSEKTLACLLAAHSAYFMCKRVLSSFA